MVKQEDRRRLASDGKSELLYLPWVTCLHFVKHENTRPCLLRLPTLSYSVVC